MKSLSPVVVEMKEILSHHCKNVIDKLSDPILVALFNRYQDDNSSPRYGGVGKSKQWRYKVVTKCLENVILGNDLTFITDEKVIQKLVNLERQNII